MSKHPIVHGGALVGLGFLVGVALALVPGCAGKGKGSRNPEACMSSCEQDDCAYNPNEVGNDAYLACLDACERKCS